MKVELEEAGGASEYWQGVYGGGSVWSLSSSV